MIEFESNDITIRATRQQYIEAKTKDLQEFGYPHLTQAHVETQLEYVLTGRRPLDIIGSFIESDSVKETGGDEQGDLE